MKAIFQIQPTVIRKSIRAGICAVLFAHVTGCIGMYDDDRYCEICLYVTIQTESADFADAVTGAGLFLFDDGRTYSSAISLSASDIAGNVAVKIPYDRNNIPWVAVWGNLGSAERLSQEPTDDIPENMSVRLTEGDDGYTAIADNLFYGAKQLTGESTERIVISPKTGRITITVRGVAGITGNTALTRSEEYHFTVTTPYDGYDFDGNTLPGETMFKLDAVFQDDDLVTAQAYNMIHFPEAVDDGSSLTVVLYGASAGIDQQPLITVDADADGNPIVIEREKTTNLLINFTGTGVVEIVVIVSDWDTVYRWDDYW